MATWLQALLTADHLNAVCQTQEPSSFGPRSPVPSVHPHPCRLALERMSIFGHHSYTYMRAPVRLENQPLYDYTLMPTHMRHTFAVDELQDIQLAKPFSSTKGCRTMKIAAGRDGWRDVYRFGTLLFDPENDPGQDHPVDDPQVERRMIDLLVKLMVENDAPPEQFERLGLDQVQA